MTTSPPQDSKQTNPFALDTREEETKVETSEKEIKQAIEDTIEDEGHHDESYFWIMQRLLWGTFKSLLLLLLLGGFIWMIWGNDPFHFFFKSSDRSSSEIPESSLSQEESIADTASPTGKKATPPSSKDLDDTDDREDKKNQTPDNSPTPKDFPQDQTVPAVGSSQTPTLSRETVYIDYPGRKASTPSTTTPSSPSNPLSNTTPSLPIVSKDASLLSGIKGLIVLAENLGGLSYQGGGRGLISESVLWLKNAKQFALVETQQVVLIASPDQRASKISARLRQGEALFAQAAVLREMLTQQVTLWQQNVEAYSTLSSQSRNRLYSDIGAFNGATAEDTLPTLNQADEKLAEAQNNLELYQHLLKNINNFEDLLRRRTIPIYAPKN